MRLRYRVIITVAAAVTALCVIGAFGYIMYLNVTNPQLVARIFDLGKKPNPRPNKELIGDMVVVDPPYKDADTTYTFGYKSAENTDAVEYLYQANFENMEGLPQQIKDTTAYMLYEKSDYYDADLNWHTVGTLNYMNADAYSADETLHYVIEYYGSDDCYIGVYNNDSMDAIIIFEKGLEDVS